MVISQLVTTHIPGRPSGRGCSMAPQIRMKIIVVRKFTKFMRAKGVAGSSGYVTSSVNSTPSGVKPKDRKPHLARK